MDERYHSRLRRPLTIDYVFSSTLLVYCRHFVPFSLLLLLSRSYPMLSPGSSLLHISFFRIAFFRSVYSFYHFFAVPSHCQFCSSSFLHFSLHLYFCYILIFFSYLQRLAFPLPLAAPRILLFQRFFPPSILFLSLSVTHRWEIRAK